MSFLIVIIIILLLLSLLLLVCFVKLGLDPFYEDLLFFFFSKLIKVNIQGITKELMNE